MCKSCVRASLRKASLRKGLSVQKLLCVKASLSLCKKLLLCVKSSLWKAWGSLALAPRPDMI